MTLIANASFAESDLACLAPAFIADAANTRAEQAACTGPRMEQLFRGLLADYGKALHYFVLRRVGNDTDAADIAQQAFVEAATSLTAFRGEAEISTWIFGIAANLVRNHLNRAPQRRYTFEDPEVLEEREAPDLDPCEALARRQLMDAVASQVAALPRCMSEALLLVSVEGLSYEDAARRLGVPVGTVRSRVSRARAAIRQGMDHAGCGQIF
jgi:RNA polymerase sigma-70 factor (ECF subfamily)